MQKRPPVVPEPKIAVELPVGPDHHQPLPDHGEHTEPKRQRCTDRSSRPLLSLGPHERRPDEKASGAKPNLEGPADQRQRARHPLRIGDVEQEPIPVEDVEVCRDRHHHQAHEEQVREERSGYERGLGAAP